MAKVSSTARPSSRQSQDGPQNVAASAPARATRSTRCQSREPSEQPPVPQQRAKSKNTAKKTGGRKQAAVHEQEELPTVEEEAVVEETSTVPDAATTEDNNNAFDDVEDDADTAVEHDLATRRMSVGAMSGTTAKTSHSQEEIGSLDPDVMVDVLPSLASASKDQVMLLLPADPESRASVRRAIRVAGTKHNKLYHNRCEAIDLHKRAFGSMPFIQPSVVLRVLMGVRHFRDVPQGDWRPDNVIYKINLTQMLRTLFVTLLDNKNISKEGFDDFSDLDTDFASCIAGPSFRPSAFDFCVETLTQLAIIRMEVYRTDLNFSPTQTVLEAFFNSDDNEAPMFRHATALHLGDLDGDQQQSCLDEIQQRVDDITEVFNEADPTSWKEALDLLRVKFSWDDFLERTMQYYSERSQELEAEITAAGGFDHVMSELSKEVDCRADARKAESKRQSLSRPSTTPRKGFGKRGIKALLEREKVLARAEAPPATAPVAQMVQPNFEGPGQTAPPAFEDYIQHDEASVADIGSTSQQVENTASASLTALAGIQNKQRHNAARMKGKGRSFLDSQPNATRVSFDSQSPQMQYDIPAYQRQTAGTGPYYQSPSRVVAKRSHAQLENDDEDFEPTQDQGFETDMRDTAAADERRRAVLPARAPQPRFSSIGSGVPGPSASASPSSHKRARKNPGSSMPATLRPIDPDDDVELPNSSLMTQARQQARGFSVQQGPRRPTQVRQQWTGKEEDAVIDYIGEEGGEGAIPWAYIKSLDNSKPEPLLARRSAEDIRFKARNMKETLLKGHMALPRNFDHIALDKKAIVKLRNLGIDYQQDPIRARNGGDEE